MDVRAITSTPARLGEGPLWDAARGRLIWTDIPACTLHTTEPASGVDRVVPRPAPVGCLVEHADGGYVLAEGAELVHVSAEFETRGVLARIDLPAGRFNDGAVDPAGRLVVGTLEPGGGRLLSLDPSGLVTTLLTGVGCSNGMAWSADGRTLYYIDSTTGAIEKIEYDMVSGELGRREPLTTIITGGLPDGLTIDEQDRLWVAVWGAGEVRCYSASGDHLRTLHLPTRRVTCPAFGGPGLGVLYVTSGLNPEPHDPTDPGAGMLYAGEVGTRGRPLPRFAGP